MGDSRDEGYWDSLGISEVAKLLRIPPSTLRYYEEAGLITPLRTEGSGYRKYSVLSLVELGDILLYRSIGIPIKNIDRLMKSPVEETASAIDQAIDETIEQIQSLDKTLKLLSLYNQRIRKFYMAQSCGARFVQRPEVEKLYSFSMKNEKSLQAYLNDLATNYCFFIESASSPDAYIDCALIPTNNKDAEIIWSLDNKTSTYLECLIRTDYCYAQRNNIASHVEYLKSLDMKPGFVVAKYLTFDYSTVDEKRYDYYLAWIQIVDPAFDLA